VVNEQPDAELDAGQPAWGIVGGMVIATIDRPGADQPADPLHLGRSRKAASEPTMRHAGLSVGLLLRARRLGAHARTSASRLRYSVPSTRRLRAGTSQALSAADDEGRRAAHSARLIHCSTSTMGALSGAALHGPRATATDKQRRPRPRLPLRDQCGTYADIGL
jgi:hypothetical protein